MAFGVSRKMFEKLYAAPFQAACTGGSQRTARNLLEISCLAAGLPGMRFAYQRSGREIANHGATPRELRHGKSSFPARTILVHNGVMSARQKIIRQSVSLPASVAGKVRVMAAARSCVSPALDSCRRRSSGFPRSGLPRPPKPWSSSLNASWAVCNALRHTAPDYSLLLSAHS